VRFCAKEHLLSPEKDIAERRVFRAELCLQDENANRMDKTDSYQSEPKHRQ